MNETSPRAISKGNTILFESHYVSGAFAVTVVFGGNCTAPWKRSLLSNSLIVCLKGLQFFVLDDMDELIELIFAFF